MMRPLIWLHRALGAAIAIGLMELFAYWDGETGANLVLRRADVACLPRPDCVLSTGMRYHKAVPITRPEADFIIENPTSSLNECVVVECFDAWYDVRRMTESELSAFVEALHREHLADIASGSITPH